MMRTIATISIGVLAALLVTTADVRADDDKITAFVDSEGRTVFTNIGGRAPAPAPPSAITTRSNVASKTTTTAPTATMPTGTGQDPIDGLIDRISARYGLESRLVRAVIQVESAFDPKAVSIKGAMGLMQLMPDTGRRFGVVDFFDPAENIEGGVRYLRFLVEKFEGNLDLLLAAYNSGEGRVERLGRIPNIKETQDYVVKVRSAYLQSPAAADPVSPQAPTQPTVLEQSTTDSQPVSTTVDERGVPLFSNRGPGS